MMFLWLGGQGLCIIAAAKGDFGGVYDVRNNNTLGHLRENCEFDGYTLYDRVSYSLPLSFLKDLDMPNPIYYSYYYNSPHEKRKPPSESPRDTKTTYSPSSEVTYTLSPILISRKRKPGDPGKPPRLRAYATPIEIVYVVVQKMSVRIIPVCCC